MRSWRGGMGLRERGGAGARELVAQGSRLWRTVLVCRTGETPAPPIMQLLRRSADAA